MKNKIILLTLAGVLLIAPPAQASTSKVVAAAGITLIGGLIAYDLLTDDEPCYASCYVCGERLHHYEVEHWAHRTHHHYAPYCPHGVRCVYEQRPVVINHVVVKNSKPHKPKIKPKKRPSRKAPPVKKGPPQHNKPAKKKSRH